MGSEQSKTLVRHPKLGKEDILGFLSTHTGPQLIKAGFCSVTRLIHEE